MSGLRAVDFSAFVAGPLAAEILASLQGKLAKMKWPKSIDFVAELPRDPSGKLLKRRLRDPYWALHAEQALAAEPAWPLPYGYALNPQRP